MVGGRVYGYRNVDIFNGVDEHGRPKRSHVIRKKVPEEAKVVEYIFELYVSGLGYKRIVNQLVADGIQAPEPRKRKDGTKYPQVWDKGKVRDILLRDIYRGVVYWNRSRKRDDWGQIKQKKRPKEEWERIDVPELRIVSAELWNRVASRMAEVRKKHVGFASGRISGRPSKHVNNLLAGIATCGECGAGLVVETSHRKAGRAHEYICSRRRRSNV